MTPPERAAPRLSRLWSRRWEYPFVTQRVIQFAQQQNSDAPFRVLDAGSGVTFFPYYIRKEVPRSEITCFDSNTSYHPMFAAVNKGIDAIRAAGADVILPDPDMFREVDLGGVMLKSWPVFTPFLEADKIINLPIAKHHGLCGVTLGMKNWYGILGGQRSRLHQQIHQSLVDLAGFMLPTLTIMDCYRILLRNGPTGGNLEDVALKKTVVAGTDPVALDAYVAKAYWDLDPERLPYLQLAATRGLGTLEFERLPVKVRQLS